MKHIFAIVLLTGIFALPTPPASTPACVCAVLPVPKAVERAGAVFVGEVVDIMEPVTTDNDAPLPGKYFTIKFKVEKSWKGVTTKEMNILSGQGKYSCFSYPPVQKGERYLVYADKMYYYGVYQNDWLRIDTCNRTARIPDSEGEKTDRPQLPDFNREDASEDLKALEQMPKP